MKCRECIGSVMDGILCYYAIFFRNIDTIRGNKAESKSFSILIYPWMRNGQSTM